MKVFFYLIGLLAILSMVALYYESEREKSFVKKDIEQAGEQLVDEMDDDSINAQNVIRTAQEDNTTLLDAVAGTIQNDVRRAKDDARGAIKLRQ